MATAINEKEDEINTNSYDYELAYIIENEIEDIKKHLAASQMHEDIFNYLSR